MYNLLLKDILIQKKVLLFGILYILIMALSFQSTGEGMFITGVVAFVYILIQTACAYDDRNKSEIMLNSLPLSRGDIVTERYLSIFAFLFIGIIEYMVIRGIVNSMAFLPVKMFPITLEGFVGAVLAIGIMSSIYFPVFFKIGYTKAKVVNFLIFFGVFFSIIPVVNMLKKYEFHPMVKDVMQWVNNGPRTVLLMGLMAVILALLGVSYMLSRYFYKNREF